MPRSVRVEYSGALYHVMARGNHRESIYLSDSDREMFLRTLGQACERTGWRVLAWVLMSNHYHLALETPEPNLVAGMTWLQTTYSRRFNCRHQQWGRLFGDRYKAIPVESAESDRRLAVDRPADYLTALIDYIHLNPVRAGIIAPERNQSVLDFPWSSIAQGYAIPPSKRAIWLDAARGLDLAGCRDDSRGRRHYVERLDRRAAAEEADRCGLPESEIETYATKHVKALNGDLRRGWYWGSDRFRERMIELAGKSSQNQRTFRQTEAGRDHGKQTAERILERGIAHFKLADEKDLRSLTGRGDLRRAAIAWAIWRQTSVPQNWIAQRLNLRTAANASQQIRRFAITPEPDLPKEIRQWKQASEIST